MNDKMRRNLMVKGATFAGLLMTQIASAHVCDVIKIRSKIPYEDLHGYVVTLDGRQITEPTIGIWDYKTAINERNSLVNVGVCIARKADTSVCSIAKVPTDQRGEHGYVVIRDGKYFTPATIFYQDIGLRQVLEELKEIVDAGICILK